MRKIENHCCDCTSGSYSCVGSGCKYRHVEVYYCDKCKDQIEGDVYEFDGDDLCEYCLLKMFKKED